jgi:zeaxanthin glucosyltransferase
LTTLILSPAYASHYGPLSTIGHALDRRGERVVIATGSALEGRVRRDGFEWRELVLGRGTNTGISRPQDQAPDEAQHLERFFAATAAGPVATLELQAERRRDDLLWQPEVAARQLAQVVAEIQPDTILTDHIALSATLALRALELPFVSYVPGHPSQLPVADEVYGAPPSWPRALQPGVEEIQRLRSICQATTATLTEEFNRSLAQINPSVAGIEDPFREHGDLTLFGYSEWLHDPAREAILPAGCRFVGPCVRDEELPAELEAWIDTDAGLPIIYVSLGTFLSARSDILGAIADALRPMSVRVAIATGSTRPDELGAIPANWMVAPTLPQVALLADASVAITHAGNNSVGEALRAGVPMITLPLSTDQFAIAADLERVGAGACLDPNTLALDSIQNAVIVALNRRDCEPPRSVSERRAGAEVAADAMLRSVGSSSLQR